MNRECPSCKDQVADGINVCPGCGYQFNTDASHGRKPIVKAASRPKIQAEVQIGITIDRTESSAQFSKGIPLTLEGILRPVAAKALKVEVWLQSHGDLDEGQQTVLLTDGAPADQAIEEAKTIVYGGGGGPEEHHFDGIEEMLNTVPWKNDPSRSRGVLIAILTADTKPATSGVTARQLGERIRQQGILLYLVCEPTPTLQELCDAASGMMFQITNTPDAAALKDIQVRISGSIEQTVRAGATVPIGATSQSVP